MRGKDGKFMRDWRKKLVEQMAAQSLANIERATRPAHTTGPRVMELQATRQTQQKEPNDN